MENSTSVESRIITNAKHEAARECGSLPGLLHAALGPTGRLLLLTLFLATLAVNLHTDLRKLPPRCMLAMHSVTLAFTALLAGCLVLVVSVCGWQAATAGELVYAFTLLSALHCLPERARVYARELFRGGRDPAPPALAALPRDFSQPDILCSPDSSASCSSLQDPSYPCSVSSDRSYASRSAHRPIDAPPATRHVPWPVRHSVDGCLLLPQPRCSSLTHPAAAAAEATLDPRPLLPQASLWRSTGSMAVCQHATAADTLTHLAPTPPPPAVRAAHTLQELTPRVEPMLRRWSLDDPPLRWACAVPLGEGPPVAFGGGNVACGVDGGDPGPGWYEALAANALVLDSLEPLNPQCASAVSQLCGIGLHACNPLMHDLQRRPSSTAADALQRFGLPRGGSASAASGVGAGPALTKVSEEKHPDASSRGRVAAGAGAVWLPDSCQQHGAEHSSDATGVPAHTHGLHACVQTLCAASMAVLWQVFAIGFWVGLGNLGSSECGGAHDSATAGTAAHSVAARLATAMPPWSVLGCHQQPPDSSSVFAFFLFAKVPARSWMRAAQLAWYAVAAAANVYTVACAAASLQHMLRTHADRAASAHRTRTSPRPIFGRRAAVTSGEDVHEPLLGPASTRGGPSSSLTQQPAPGSAFPGAPQERAITAPPASRPDRKSVV